MGVALDFEFDKDVCEGADAYGVSRSKDGTIFLDPTEGISDNVLLDTAFHELVEMFNDRMELGLEHRTIQQLGMLGASVLEWDG